MRLRKDETAALVETLETEWPSAEAAASAVYNKVVELLAERDSYGLRVSVGPTLHLAYGPLWDMTQAKKLAKELPGMASIAPLSAPTPLFRALQDPVGTQACPACFHPRFSHVGGKLSRCIAGRVTNKAGTEIAAGCGCREVFK